MNIENLSKLSFLKIEKYHYESEHTCDFHDIPRPHFCIGLLLEGLADFISDKGEVISIVPGDLIFVPITSTYISKWKCNPEVVYISMHFEFDPLCGISENNHYILQKISKKLIKNFEEKFTYAYEIYNGNNTDKMKALSIFFDVLSSIIPYLKQTKENDIDDEIKNAVEFLKLNCTKEINMAELTKHSCMSPSNFYIKFKKYMSMTPVEYKNHICIRQAMHILKKDNNLSIEEISESLGFNSYAYFRRLFKKYIGISPSEYKKAKIEI